MAHDPLARKATTLALATGLAMGLGAALPATATAEEAFERAKVAAGEILYKEGCRRCHASDADHASYGPPLNDIVGRAAGTYPDYDYSDALAGSGIVWTDAALRAWMEDNKGFMPGTKMRHVGIQDRTVQDMILAYLHDISKTAPN